MRLNKSEIKLLTIIKSGQPVPRDKKNRVPLKLLNAVTSLFSKKLIHVSFDDSVSIVDLEVVDKLLE